MSKSNTPSLMSLNLKIANGLQCFKSGDLVRARLIFENLRVVSPRNADVLHFLGLVLHGLGQHELALRHIQDASSLAPKNAEIQSNLGFVHEACNDSRSAIVLYRKAIQLNPNYPQAHINLANVLEKEGQILSACAHAKYAQKISPTIENAMRYARLSLRIGENGQARTAYEWILSREPKNIRALSGLGQTMSATGQLEEAVKIFSAVVNLDQSISDSWNNYGAALLAVKDYPAAEFALDMSLKLHPGFVPALVNYCGLLTELGRYRQVIGLIGPIVDRGCEDVPLLSQYAMALRDLGRTTESLAVLQRAQVINPSDHSCNWTRALVQLGLGRFDEGWADYDLRVKPKFKSSRSRWDGGGNPGRLLVIGEQGIGDEVFFSSGLALAPLLSTDIQVQTDKRLVTLFKRSFQSLRIVGAENRETSVAPVESYDRYMLIGSVFKALREHVSSPESMTRGHFLKADSKRTENIRQRLAVGKKKICGITWRSQRAEYGHRKGMSLNDLLPVLSLTNVKFVSLQYGDVDEEIELLRRQTGIQIEVMKEIDNYTDIDAHAALIDACDFCVLVSNTTAHIAGGLGKKACVLVMQGRGRLFYWNNVTSGKSFWYPTLTIANQSSPGDWAGAIDVARDFVVSQVAM